MESVSKDQFLREETEIEPHLSVVNREYALFQSRLWKSFIQLLKERNTCLSNEKSVT
jgi:hypothetical protein